jgi:prepilin-type N-terminal cleavage/methylation domain-containing protein
MLTWRTKRAFTLIELLVALAVVVLLAGMIFPVFAAAREQGRQGVCLSNLRQLGQALAMYRDEHGSYPPFGGHTQALVPYLKDRRVLFCPSHRDPPGIEMASGYGYLLDGDRLRQTGRILGPRSVIVFCLSHHRWEGLDSAALSRLKPSIYSGAFTLLRHDGSTAILPADRVTVRIRATNPRVPPFAAGVEVLEFPE